MTPHERLIVKVSSWLVLLGKLLLTLALVIVGPYTPLTWPMMIGLAFMLFATACYVAVLWRCLTS